MVQQALHLFVHTPVEGDDAGAVLLGGQLLLLPAAVGAIQQAIGLGDIPGSATSAQQAVPPGNSCQTHRMTQHCMGHVSPAV